MNQRSQTGSATSRIMVPSGTASAAAAESGSTSRRWQRGQAGTAKGAPLEKSINRMVTAATRG